MARDRTIFRCLSCGSESPQWVGRCSVCGDWNTLVEEVAQARPVAAPPKTMDPIPISEIDPSAWSAYPSGVSELDRVLGGGLVPGSVTLLGGEPGIGKSTLLLQALASLARSNERVLYVSGEESAQQVRLRAERLQALEASLWLVTETDVNNVLTHIGQLKPTVVVIDSIQTMSTQTLSASAGSVSQVRECAAAIVRDAKRLGFAVVLVGHVTKDGALAGPRVLEHMVDTVLSFEGERHHSLRLLRAVKHRFGPTDELGLFEMQERGLAGVPDPSQLFLSDRARGVSGSIVVPTIEGHRPLLVELQSLVANGSGGSPRRSSQGVEHGRLAFMLAVLEQRAEINLSGHDVYALAVGGVKIIEPAADLPLALAVASARYNKAISPKLVAFGEVGLGGEVRQVSQTARRLGEAARLGFTEAIVPKSVASGPAGVKLIRVGSLSEALEYALPSRDNA